jgi:murein L,D-transpeptidase YcbB/YkuD
MRSGISIIFILILLLQIAGCEKKTEPTLNEKLNFSNALYERSLSNIFSTGYSTIFISPELKKNLDTLFYVYAERKFKPIFLKSFESKNFIDSLLDILGSAYQHGLNPENYNYTQIKNEFNDAVKIETDYHNRFVHLANTELLAADGIIKYAEHLRHGVVNPRTLYPNRYFLPVTDSLNKKFFEPLNQNDIIQYLINIQPESDKYKKLQAALQHFDSLKNIDWTLIPIPDKKIEIGDSYSFLNSVAQKLTTLGFIDTSKIKINDLSVYDTLIAAPVREFQRVNGLADDGVIGKSTIERLNISPKDYISKIKLNLERFRWINYSDTSGYIVVNIPDFKLYAIEHKVEKFNIKVCTGRKNEWETPILYGQISYFVLNPTWSVPRSIVEEEIVAGLRKDSTYLKKRNFKAFKYGKQVSLDGLTGKELLSSKSYILVQDPGLGNALGKIKFMFRNPFGVYLHDTPTRAPFNYVNRAVSHGCVRVEKPIQLAEYLLRNNSKWTIDYLKIEIGQKVNDKSIVDEYYRKRTALRKNFSYGVTTEVKLDNKIPVFIDYYTVWVDKDGKLNYRDDVYNRDQILAEHLFAEN